MSIKHIFFVVLIFILLITSIDARKYSRNKVYKKPPSKANKANKPETDESRKLKAESADKHIRFISPAEFSVHIDKGLWIIMYGANWCKYTQKLTPKWLGLQNRIRAENLSRDINIAKVECSKYKDFCTSQGIDGYPTIYLYENGQKYEEYQGNHEINEMFTYVQEQVARYKSEEVVEEVVTVYVEEVVYEDEKAENMPRKSSTEDEEYYQQQEEQQQQQQEQEEQQKQQHEQQKKEQQKKEQQKKEQQKREQQKREQQKKNQPQNKNKKQGNNQQKAQHAKPNPKEIPKKRSNENASNNANRKQAPKNSNSKQNGHHQKVKPKHAPPKHAPPKNPPPKYPPPKYEHTKLPPKRNIVVRATKKVFGLVESLITLAVILIVIYAIVRFKAIKRHSSYSKSKIPLYRDLTQDEKYMLHYS